SEQHLTRAAADPEPDHRSTELMEGVPHAALTIEASCKDEMRVGQKNNLSALIRLWGLRRCRKHCLVTCVGALSMEAGAAGREAAERFEISASSAVKWLQRWRDHGVCAPKPRGGSRSVLEDYGERILALVAEQPDRTLDEIVAAMRKRRIPGSRSAL